MQICNCLRSHKTVIVILVAIVCLGLRWGDLCALKLIIKIQILAEIGAKIFICSFWVVRIGSNLFNTFSSQNWNLNRMLVLAAILLKAWSWSFNASSNPLVASLTRRVMWKLALAGRRVSREGVVLRVETWAYSRSARANLPRTSTVDYHFIDRGHIGGSLSKMPPCWIPGLFHLRLLLDKSRLGNWRQISCTLFPVWILVGEIGIRQVWKARR